MEMRVSSTRQREFPLSSYGDRVGPALYVSLTIDDLVAFNRHVLQTSPLAKQQLRRTQRRMMPSLLIWIGWMWVFRWYENQLLSPFALVLTVAYVFSILFLGTITELRVPARLRRSFTDGLRPPLSPSRLWVDASGGVVDESPNTTTWFSPSAIQRIEETPEYVFVFVGPARALIIPRRADEAAVRTFVQALTWRRADRDPFVSDWR